MKAIIIFLSWLIIQPVIIEKPLLPSRNELQPTNFKRYCLSMEMKPSSEKMEKFQNAFKGAKWHTVKEKIMQLGGKSIQLYSLNGEQLMILDTERGFHFAEAMEKLKKSKAYDKWKNSSEPFHLDIPGNNKGEEWQNYVSKYQRVDPESSTKVKWKLMERL